MAGLDSFLLLTPILMLPVVALLVFVGCNQVFGIEEVHPYEDDGVAHNLQANPGIPAPGTRITPVDLTWDYYGDYNYKISRSLWADGPFTTIGETSSHGYTDETVTDGEPYYYVVGDPTQVVSVTPQPPFVTAFSTLGGVQNNLSGYWGMAIQVGSNPITVYALGRLMVAGNSSIHEIRIADASNNSVVASVVVNMAGEFVRSFVYTALPTPVTLNANAGYYVVSLEESGGDQWHSDSTTIATTDVATVTASVQADGATYQMITPGATYGPLDFLYL